VLFLPLSVCLSVFLVCVSTRLLKSILTDYDEICGGLGRGPRDIQLDFGDDPYPGCELCEFRNALKYSLFTIMMPADSQQ